MSNETSPDDQQGALFRTEVNRQFGTETMTPTPDGTYPATAPAEVPTDPETQAFWDRVAAAAQEDRNRKAQSGRHSAIDEATGRYTDIRPGRYLPGFGIIYDNNLGAAIQFAETLNRELDRRDSQK